MPKIERTSRVKVNEAIKIRKEVWNKEKGKKKRKKEKIKIRKITVEMMKGKHEDSQGEREDLAIRYLVKWLWDVRSADVMGGEVGTNGLRRINQREEKERIEKLTDKIVMEKIIVRGLITYLEKS